MRNIHVRARLRQAPLTAQQRTPLFIYDLRLIKPSALFEIKEVAPPDLLTTMASPPPRGPGIDREFISRYAHTLTVIARVS
jgi:hypothetical protein